MKKIVVFLLSMFVSMAVSAAIIGSLPYTIVNGQPVDATPIMGNYNWLVSQTNANAAKNGVNSDITSATALVQMPAVVGFGAAASTWSAGYNVIDLGNIGSIYAAPSETTIVSNGYYNSSWKRKISGYAADVSLAYGSGAINFYNADTGAPDSAISFVKQVSIPYTASAVNYLTLTGAAAGSGPKILVDGSDTNTQLILGSKGTGQINFKTEGTVTQAVIADTPSAVNYLTLTGGATTVKPSLSVAGSDSNIGINILTKGSGSFVFASSNGTDTQAVMIPTASAVNYVNITGGTTGSGATIATAGANSNINLNLTPKGTGSVVIPHMTGAAIGSDVQAYTATLNTIAGLTPTNGYVMQGNGTTWVTTAAGTYTPSSVAITGGTISGISSLAVTGAVTSTKSCAAGFKRISPNYCAKQSIAFTSVNPPTSTAIAAPSANATAITIHAEAYAKAAGTHLQRGVNMVFSGESPAVTVVNYCNAAGEEETGGDTAGEQLGVDICNFTIPLSGAAGSSAYVAVTGDAGGYSAATISVTGYYD